jgi:hypothetical protein
MDLAGRARIDGPRSNREPEELARKRRLLAEPHMQPLNRFVDELRARRPERVPDLDPTEAGVAARVLLLLETPGRRAVDFVSPDNDDGPAENMWKLLREAQVERSRDVVTWNVVPWYAGTERGGRSLTSGDLRDGSPPLTRFLELLPNLSVVVLLGRNAFRAWEQAIGPEFGAFLLRAPHPSPQSINPHPIGRQLIRDALVAARCLSDCVDPFAL